MDTSTVGTSPAANYALQVALQTVKERCIQLQRRVSTIEDENQRLREGIYNNRSSANANASASANATLTNSGDNVSEIQSLRSQVADLQRQKEQLSEHINMVSNENRRLWSRLSQISKEQSQQPQTLTTIMSSKNDEPVITGTSSTLNSSSSVAAGGNVANPNLIRSKTFTQHSPNPHLRQKVISEGLRDVSLEEIALDDFGAGDTFAANYPYDDDGGNSAATDPDANVDAKRCMESLQDMRREAMKQQQELSSALTLLETRIALHPCPDCAQKAAHKPETADKSLETDESLSNELKRYQNDTNNTTNQLHDTVNGHNGYGTTTTTTTAATTTTTPPSSRLNIIQEKLKADALLKTCPMCGKTYSSQISFKAFQEHVEMHFIDDALEIENSIDRNFEFISHTVGDF